MEDELNDLFYELRDKLWTAVTAKRGSEERATAARYLNEFIHKKKEDFARLISQSEGKRFVLANEFVNSAYLAMCLPRKEVTERALTAWMDLRENILTEPVRNFIKVPKNPSEVKLAELKRKVEKAADRAGNAVSPIAGGIIMATHKVLASIPEITEKKILPKRFPKTAASFSMRTINSADISLKKSDSVSSLPVSTMLKKC